jgi:hypothetical protein
MKQISPRFGRLAWAAVLISALISVSCGQSGRPKLYPVRGKVLHDGQPAAGARVTFYPKDRTGPQSLSPVGTVLQDGSFELTTFKTGDGAPAGEYDVAIVWPTQPGRKAVAAALVDTDRLNGAYSDPARSGLQARVVEGKNELPSFELR